MNVDGENTICGRACVTERSSPQRTTAVLQLWLTVSAAWAQAVTVAEINERMLIAEAAQRLTRRYAQLPADQISTAVHNAHARFTQSPIRDFVPLLVERRAGQELSRLTELLIPAQ